MTKTTRARYTLESKQEAVRLVDGGQSIAAAARTLGLVEQTLFNWVKAKREGKLSAADSKAVSAEQMEISRLRAELARVKMERDILEKATAYFAKAQRLSTPSFNANTNATDACGRSRCNAGCCESVWRDNRRQPITSTSCAKPARATGTRSAVI